MKIKSIKIVIIQMKNLQFDFHQPLLQLEGQHESIVFVDEEVFCSYGKTSINVCINKRCSANPFICDDQKCGCGIRHQKCKKIQTSGLIRRIKEGTISLDSIDDTIDQIVQNMIDGLSDFRDKIQLKLKQDLVRYSFTKNQQQFLERIDIKKFSLITSKQVQEIFSFRQKKQKIITDIINKSKQQVQKRFNEVTANLFQIFELVTEDIESLKKRLQIISSNDPENNSNQILLSKLGSKIVKTQLQDKALSTFFPPMEYDSIRLLYRASENDFSIKKFYELCDGIPNTLVLIETEYGKKIGGYTPIKWKRKGNGMNDESMSSFLFSLTEGDKFTLLSEKDFAVYHNSIHGPVFGKGNDLFISDKANIYSISHANINYSYYNQKYNFNDQKSWLKFIGKESSRFKIIQWEVWGLVFD